MSVVAALPAHFSAYLDARGDSLLRAFTNGFAWPEMARTLPARRLPVVDVLRDAMVSKGSLEEPLLLSLIAAADALDWRQTYSAADLDQQFLDNYGWVEMFGERGYLECNTMAGGFLLLGPNTRYPDHYHLAEEIYIPLTGTAGWSRGGEPFQRCEIGEIIHHPSNVWHAMQTGEAPLAALYLWRGGPLAAKSTIVERSSN
jgi:hypothetical protein